MKPDYIAAGSWPDDAVEMTDKEKETYWTKQAPFGKQLGGDNKGHPAWINTQPLSHEEAVAEAEAKSLACYQKLLKNWPASGCRRSGYGDTGRRSDAERVEELSGDDQSR